jgi:hypothetical protein
VRLLRALIASVALIAVGAAAAAVKTASAAPGAYLSVLHVYESQRTIPACRFSSPQLEDALKGVDTYGAQYFADFTQAIQGALSGRAAGACSPPGPGSSSGAGSSETGGLAGGSAPGARPAAASGPSAHFGPLTAATSAGVPAPLLLLGALAAALTVFGTAAGLRRTRRQG